MDDTSVEEAVQQIRDQEAAAAAVQAEVFKAAAAMAERIANWTATEKIVVDAATTLAFGMLFAKGSGIMNVPKEEYMLVAEKFFDHIANAPKA